MIKLIKKNWGRDSMGKKMKNNFFKKLFDIIIKLNHLKTSCLNSLSVPAQILRLTHIKQAH
jgi:PhoPQ-activated pathogenicity-related protein